MINMLKPDHYLLVDMCTGLIKPSGNQYIIIVPKQPLNMISSLCLVFLII